MIRGHQAQSGGLIFTNTPSRRQLTVRRRWQAVGVIAAVALAGAVLGHMSAARDDRPVPPGPLTYLPF